MGSSFPPDLSRLGVFYSNYRQQIGFSANSLTKEGGVLSRRLTHLFVPINVIQPTFLHKIREISRKLCHRISLNLKLREN